jgi:hypothetical protein
MNGGGPSTTYIMMEESAAICMQMNGNLLHGLLHQRCAGSDSSKLARRMHDTVQIRVKGSLDFLRGVNELNHGSVNQISLVSLASIVCFLCMQ